jgi:hypothetical protein
LISNWENSKLCENTPPGGCGVSTQFILFTIPTRVESVDVIYEQRERVFHRVSKHEKTMYENTSVFIHCFRVFEYPGETRARVVYMASQMNRDVTECFRLLI